MGPEFGMIKDENEDPSSPKKSRIEKKDGKKPYARGTLSSAYRLMPCHVGGGGSEREDYKKPDI